MRILIVHNHYQLYGGEDSVVKSDFELLRDFGEEVYLHERSNDEIRDYSRLKKLSFLMHLGWNKESFQEIKKLLRDIKPDVVHFHNVFYVLSPYVYWACREAGVPVVQSQHNFRLLCPNALFMRNGKVCEECFDKKSFWPGIYHRCYKKSALMTFLIARAIKEHWTRGTFSDCIEMYTIASELGRQKYIAAGIPEDRIVVKPNIVYPQMIRTHQDQGYALYAGRLYIEKGVHVLLKGWKSMDGFPLKIIGKGYEAERLKRYVEDNGIKNVEFLGFVSDEQFDQLMAGAKFLVLPYVCYEHSPRTITEAYCYGIPVLTSDLGAMSEVVKHKETGLLFKTGDAKDLLQKAKWLRDHPEQFPLMEEKIRQFNETYFSPKRNYEVLMSVYNKAVSEYRK